MIVYPESPSASALAAITEARVAYLYALAAQEQQVLAEENFERLHRKLPPLEGTIIQDFIKNPLDYMTEQRMFAYLCLSKGQKQRKGVLSICTLDSCIQVDFFDGEHERLYIDVACERGGRRRLSKEQADAEDSLYLALRFN